MTASRWVLTASYGVLLIVSIIWYPRLEIGLFSGLILTVSLLVIWREARQIRADREVGNRG
ncbi:hypothetical protein AUQ48_17205 [Kocuria flava]|uniref:Uncharacterized protein n=1 Tax=Kocuria flava TaxID=446860 RepID=A0A2N4SXT2_9MICC|nr:hypothetical protein AUQ48_17205 [Kocuria flava]